MKFLNFALSVACLAVFTHSVTAQVSTVEQVDKLVKGPDHFIEGNLYFIAYHEIAHAFISEFDLPVIGREEDAADRLAIKLMTPEPDAGDPDYLIGAMKGWFTTAERTPLDEISWWDEHGTDQQRGFQISCLLFGADKNKFKAVAEAVNLPDERRESCEFEATQNNRAWDSLLEPHYLPEGQKPTAGEMSITYKPTKDFKDDLTYLKELQLLEDIRSYMADNYSLKPGIKIVAEECGEPNAYWNGDERKITFCYELVRDFRDLAQ